MVEGQEQRSVGSVRVHFHALVHDTREGEQCMLQRAEPQNSRPQHTANQRTSERASGRASEPANQRTSERASERTAYERWMPHLSFEIFSSLMLPPPNLFSVPPVARFLKLPSSGPPVPAFGELGSLANGQPNWSMKPANSVSVERTAVNMMVVGPQLEVQAQAGTLQGVRGSRAAPGMTR